MTSVNTRKHVAEAARVEEPTTVFSVIHPRVAEKMSRAPRKESRLWGSARLTLAIVGFFGFANLYALRVNLSLVMVCMINHAAVEGNDNGNATGGQQNQTDQSQQYSNEGDFTWSKHQQGLVLGAFFWGYIVTQIPGGILAERLGGKFVFLFPALLAAICTILCPLAANLHIIAFMALRVVIGMCEGVAFPAMHSIWSKWAPPLERTKLCGMTYSGTQIGNVIAIAFAAILCDLIGWEAVYYAFGILGIIWCFFWFLLASSSPNECKRISSEEKSYIKSCLADKEKQSGDKDKKELKKPWIEFLKSGPVWAIVISHTCANFGTDLMMTSLPSFMNEALHFDLKSNGFLSALPYVAYWIGIIFAGFMADFLIKKKILSITVTRKLFMLLALIGQACALVGVGFCEKGQEMLAVGLLVVSQGFSGLQYAGYLVNHVDIAPRYAGTLVGISNTVATIPGIVAPIIATSLTPDKSLHQWRLVFIIAASILTFGSLFYAVFGSGRHQSWATYSESTELSYLSIGESTEEHHPENTKRPLL